MIICNTKPLKNINNLDCVNTSISFVFFSILVGEIKGVSF